MDKEMTFQPVIHSGIANTQEIISDKEHMIEMQNTIQDSLKTEVSTFQ